MYISPLQPVFYIFAFVSIVYVLHLGMYLISANLYDVWQSRRVSHRHHSRTKQKTPANQPEPLVSVIISAHNEQKVIVRSLDSIAASSYHNFEVLVADDASTDQTFQLVRDYALRHPGFKLRVFRMHRNKGKGAALNCLLRRYVRGTLVMTLDADSLLRHDTIKQAVAYFSDPRIAGVAANVRIIDEPTFLGVLQKLEHMVGYRSKKMYSLLNCEFVVGGVASTYRTEVMRKVGFYDTDTVTEDIGLSIKITNLGNQSHRMIYAANVVAMTEGVSTFKALAKQRYRWKYGSFQNLIKYRRLLFNPSREYSRTLTFYRVPMALISEFGLLVAPLAWAYVIYMTFVQYNPTLIIGAYATITLYMLIIVWFDENLKTKGRLKLSGYVLISYFIFFIMDLVQLIAIARCIWHMRALITQKNVGGHWVSPSRSGKRMRHIYET